MSAIDRVKKASVSKATTSTIAQKAIKKSIRNDETIDALKAVIRATSTGGKKADEMEKNIVAVCVKAYLLVDNRTIRAEEFIPADKLLRSAFDLLVKIYHGKARVQKEEIIVAALEKVEKLLKVLERVLVELLSQHLAPKHAHRISFIFSEIANKDFLLNVLNDVNLKPQLEVLVTAMASYTQL